MDSEDLFENKEPALIITLIQLKWYFIEKISFFIALHILQWKNIIL